MFHWLQGLFFCVVGLLCSKRISCMETNIGGVYSSNAMLTLAKSPYAVTKDLIVSQNTILTIEAGVEMNFQARVRLIVNGTVNAVGTREREISMHHFASAGIDSDVLRLVGGNSSREGRIEVYDAASGSWGTVCDDNWKKDNARVVCRHLGFNNPIGSDYSTRRFGPGSGIIGLSNVHCDGAENSLLDCSAERWNRSRCNHFEDVGVVCGKGSVGFWGGMLFASGGVDESTVNGARVFSTSSILKNVRVSRAGVVRDELRRSQPDQTVAAITADTALAKMVNVTILSSRSSNVQLNDIHADIDIENLNVLNCTGFGISGRSSRRLKCVDCHLDKCRIDLTRIALPLVRPEVKDVSSYDFGSIENGGSSESHFVNDSGGYINFTQTDMLSRYVTHVLETDPGYGMTISFSEFSLKSPATSYFIIYDGYTGFNYLHRTLSPIAYRSIPDSITVDYHRVVFFFHSSIYGDARAYVSRHRLDSRRVDLINCSTGVSSARLPRRTYGLQFRGFLGTLFIDGYVDWYAGMHIVGQGNAIEIISSFIQRNPVINRYPPSYAAFLEGAFTRTRMLYCRFRSTGFVFFKSGKGDVTFVDNIMNGTREGFFVTMDRLPLYVVAAKRTIIVERNVLTRVLARVFEIYISVHEGLLSVKNNVVFDCNGYVKIRHFGGPYTTAVIFGNIIEGNYVSPVISIFSVVTNTNLTTVEQNVFKNNKGLSIVLLADISSLYRPKEVILHFRNNTLKGNKVYNRSETAKPSPPAILEIFGNSNVQVYHNVFDNPESSFEVCVETEATSSLDKINFTLNYWSTSDEFVIRNRIYDFYDSNYVATATYCPFLLSSDPLNVTKLPCGDVSSLMFLGLSGDIGGLLNSTLTLSAASSPYLMTKDVTILPTGKLVIEAGVVIEALEYTGILVEGSMMSLGTADSPVVIRSAVPPVEDIRFIDGVLQIFFEDEWRSICIPSTLSGYYSSFPRLVCERLGYNYYRYWRQEWFPELGTPVIASVSCIYRAAHLNDCTFSARIYTPSLHCLSRLELQCSHFAVQVHRRVRDRISRGRWAGVRFSPTSTIPKSGNDSHTLPSSSLFHTVIQNAGRSTSKDVPAVKSVFRSPKILNLTITDCASTGLMLEYLHEKTNIFGVVVDKGGGDGISVRGPGHQSETYHDVTIRNVAGAGVRSHSTSTSPSYLTNYQSICLSPPFLQVDEENGTYIGLHPDDYIAGKVCSVVLRGPPNTVLLVTVVFFQFLDGDQLVLQDGPNKASPSLRTYNRVTYSYGRTLSTASSVYVELTSGQHNRTSRFSLHAVAFSKKPSSLQYSMGYIHILDSYIFSTKYGVHVNGGWRNISITNLRSENCSFYGVYVDGVAGLLSITNSSIRNSHIDGIRTVKSYANVQIVNNKVIGSSDAGIRIDDICHPYYSRWTSVVESNLFGHTGNTAVDVSFGSKHSGRKWKIMNNLFEANENGLLLSSFRDVYLYYHVTIAENAFQNHTGRALEFDEFVNVYARIESNTFATNFGESIYLRGRTLATSVARNEFFNNGGKYVVVLLPFNFTQSPFVFENNTLVGNVINPAEIRPSGLGCPAVVALLSSQVVIRGNEFNNPESSFELSIHLPVQSSSEVTVDVRSNYWGTTSEDVIRDRICDFGQISRLASADFIPYLMSANGSAVSANVSQEGSILRRQRVLRGRVLADTVIPLSGSPFTVVGDISVLPGKTLTVEAGTEIRFSANTGILVEGRLVARGTESQPIRFVGHDLAMPKYKRSVRLYGGTSMNEGIVQVYYNETWGAVCALQDESDVHSTSHNFLSSNIVCKELGYKGAVTQQSQNLYSNKSYSGDAWIEHLLCRGSETSIRSCINYVHERSVCALGALQVVCVKAGSTFWNERSPLYWSGVRFSQSASLNVSHVFVSGAGFADGVKIPAILAVGSALEMNDVDITGNAWTGISLVNAPVANLNRLNVSSNEGTGLRLSNTFESALHDVTAVGNEGHGLALARDGFLLSFWHYPVEKKQLVDVCTQSGPVSAEEPFYLRFVPRLSQVAAYSQSCSVSVRAKVDYVLSFSIMSLHFQSRSSYLKIDGQDVYSSGEFKYPDLHHVTSGSSAEVSFYVYIDLEDFLFNPWADYALIYVQQHSTKVFNSSSHIVTNGFFAANWMSGVAFNSSRSVYDRSSVSISSSTISANSWNGIDGNMTSDDSPKLSFGFHEVKILRSAITENGQCNASAGGVSLRIDHVNVSIQNNGIADNVGGAISINLTTSRSESTSVNVFDNRIVRNKEGDIIKVHGSSLSSGVTVNIGSNTVNHNSGGIQFDTLTINKTAAVVAKNTFYNNTGRFVVSWETGQRSSVSGQEFVNNTLFWNVCQKPDYRWSVYAIGIGPWYTENTFDNPSNLYELASGPDAGHGAHKATENWWGTPDASEAAKRVRDKNDVPSLTDVDIVPVKSVPPLNANKGCPFGWVREDSYHLQCYLYVRSAVDWNTANEFCKVRHATLASSHSASVDAFLNALSPRAPSSLSSFGGWLGLRRAGEQAWLWSDGSTLDYINWIGKAGGENCAKLTSNGWDAEDCNARLPFYCIKPPADGCPNSCSQRGRCVKGNCLCFSGWKGSDDCSAFDCSNVNNCSGRGECVGPNQCRCRVGWKGRACTTTYCNPYATCHSCTRQPGCGWCDSQQKCLPGLGVGSDTEECEAWFYYGCFAPSRMSNCSERIRGVNCSELCGKRASNETEQHCHDIDRCYFNNTSCSGWNESLCPYGRVTPDYGLGAQAPKIPSHLPNGKPSIRGRRSALGDSSGSGRRKKFVDLHRDVRVVNPSTSRIYRLLAAEDFNYYVVKPPLEKIFVGQILASRQSGGVLDKVLATSTFGQYQFVKANPAKLEEVFQYVDFIDSVTLEDVYDEAAVELVPNVGAFQSSDLPGALQTAIVSPSTSIYKCKRSAKDGRIVIAARKNQASALSKLTLGIVSHATSGFLEQVTAIHAAGLHTIVHTTLAICSNSLSFIKLEVSKRNVPQTIASPSMTGVGGNGLDGIVIYENVLPSGLDLSVGDIIVGRPSGPVAGYVVDYYNSYDDVVTFIELDHASGVGVAPCASGRASRWCDLTKGSLVYHEIIKLGDVTSNTVVNYSPQIQMTFRSNQTSPFVSKLGFVFDGSITIGSQTNLSLSAKDLDGVLYGQTHGNDHQQFFCIDIGPTCIRGKLTVSVEYMFHLDYNLAKHGAEFLFAYEAESRGSLRVGSIWRNGVGLEYIKQANFHTIQKLIRHPHQSSSFESSVVPTFAIEWPMSHKTEPYVKSAIPDFMKMALSSPSTPVSESKFFLEIIPALRGHFVTKRCYEGCDFGKKLLAFLLSGVHEVEVYSSVDLLFFDTSRIYKWQSADFVNVISGLCLPVDDESDCSCQCPFEGKCSDDGKGVKICQTCDCVGLPGCHCRPPCPNGTVEASNPSSSVAQPECLCQCADLRHASVGADGKCQCGCTCDDGSRSVIGPDGTCECACKCKNCMDSFLGPSGCICPKDKCPACREGLEAVWQDCTCSCQSKHGRGGLPPVCSEGWTGPYCDIPDCCPLPFCSFNGVCVNPAGNEIDRKPYCLCNSPPWEGEFCEININAARGDPHMQTLDGFSYDFFDIGEFWYCKSVSNNFGVSARFYKYQRTSLTGAVAVKAGTSVVTVSTLHSPGPNDLPVVRVNGLVTRLIDGLKLNLPDESVHVEPSLFSNGTSKEKIALIAFQFSNGVGLSLDVQYSPVMQRQFINIAFLVGSSFKRTTEGLCGFMDGNVSNDLVGSDGVIYPQKRVLEFAKSWKISQTFDGSGLNGTWSWNHSNFHKDDIMDSSYTDPLFVPVYTIKDIDSSTTTMAEDLCKQKGLNGVRLTECIFDVAITNDTSLAEQEDYQTGCPTRCSGKGRCANTTCICLPGWSGDDCSQGSCSNCSINGDCVSGFCQCHFGWDGPLCDEPATCYDVDNCTNSSQGLCKSRNFCQCSAGFTGSSCSEVANCTLLRDCFNHGVCIDHDKCKCDVGWAGVDCSKLSCESVGYCSNHGSCVGYDVCKCDEGWSGSSCAIPSCTNRGNCSGNGECSAPNTCDCYAGFSGQDCEIPIHCPELNDCSGNGVCQSQNKRKYCLCYSGYEGNNCSLTSCKGQKDCSGRGVCVELDLCECFYGYTGPDCSEYSCEKRNFCSGHGRCLRFDICTCNAKWSGLDCSVPDCTGVNNCGNASTGVCVGPDACDCTQGYDGDRCDQLAGINLHSPHFNSSSLHFYVSVSSAAGHRVAAVSAEDSDMGRNGRMTYSLTSSTGHHAFFKVNAQTGEIFTTAILDGHLGSELHIIMVASDGGAPSLSGSVDVSVKVISPNFHCPVFMGLPLSIEIGEAEAVPGSLILQLNATDADSDASPNGEIEYSLLPDSADVFHINSSSGSVTLLQHLTLESYVLNFIASDKGQPPCSSKGSIGVGVRLSNRAPSCISPVLIASVPYTTPPGSVLFSLKAIDLDNGTNGQINYTLTNFHSSVLQRDQFFLRIDSKAEVTLDSALSKPTGDVFDMATFTVTAQDRAVEPKSCNFDLTLTVFHEFTFAHSSLDAKINESVPIGFIVNPMPSLFLRTSLNSSTVSYKLYNAELLPYSVDEKTGILSVIKALDYEQEREHNVTVIAATAEVPGALAVATIQIKVINVNDNAPKFTRSRYFATVDELAQGGELILKLSATDLDSGLNRSAIGYEMLSISPSGSRDTFDVRLTSDAIGIYLSHDAVINYQILSKFTIVMQAWDKELPRLSSKATVVVTVKEAANAKKPVFFQRQYRAELNENSPYGFSVMQVVALVNGRPSNDVKYAIQKQTLNPGSGSSDCLEITPQGVIQVANSSQIDYETIREIDLIIQARVDQPVLRTSEASVVVSILDVNDNSPVFEEMKYNVSIPLDYPEGQVFLDITASDSDSGTNGEIVYSLVSSENQKSVCEINPLSGTLFLSKELDWSSYGTHKFTATATDNGTPRLSGSSTIYLNVTCPSSLPNCSEMSSSGGSSVPLAYIIGGAGGFVILLIIISVAVVLVKGRKREKDRGAYTPTLSQPAENPKEISSEFSNPVFAGEEVSSDPAAVTFPSKGVPEGKSVSKNESQ